MTTWLLIITVAVAVLVVVIGVSLLCWWIKDDAVLHSHDPVINIDQWTEERRQHLADLHRPAAKFIEARRRK